MFKHALLLLMLTIGVGFAVADEFPIGMYGVKRSDAYFKDMKNAGFSIVHCYATRGANEKEAKRLLDNAEKHQFKAMLCLRGVRWYKKHKDFTGILEFIKKIKDHPALSICMLEDEPKNNQLKTVIKLNELIKAEAPSLPTAVVEQWDSGWWHYGSNKKCSDILMQDLYPVGDQSFPNAPLNKFSDFIGKGIKLGKPLMPVVQIFNFKVYPKEVKRRKYTGKCRYPNKTEVKFMTWSSVARGVSGIFYYSLERSLQLDRKGKYLNNVVFPISRELRDFSKLAAPLQEPSAKQLGENKSYFVGYWKRDSGEYMVIVNNSKSKQDCQIKLSSKGFTPWGTSRETAKIQNSKIELLPWETVILKK